MPKKIGRGEVCPGCDRRGTNSPGGTTAGGQALIEALRNVAKTKPQAAEFGTIAICSAAYIAGSAVWTRSSHVQYYHGLRRPLSFSGRTSPNRLKACKVQGHSLSRAVRQGGTRRCSHLVLRCRAATEQMVAELQRRAPYLVCTRRGIDTKGVLGLEQGRVFSGRDALNQKPIDEIGRRGRGRAISRGSVQHTEGAQDRGLEGEP